MKEPFRFGGGGLDGFHRIRAWGFLGFGKGRGGGGIAT